MDGKKTDVGDYDSMVLAVGGLPVIAYYDATNHDLRVASCKKPNCKGAKGVTVDSAGDVGVFTSVRLDANGFPVVSYRDVTNGDLKVLHCGSATCKTGNTITAPDTAGDTGYNTSLALDGSGFPVVSYNDGANDLKVLHCGDATCSSGNTITTPDSSHTVSNATSLRLDGSGNPVVAYNDYVDGTLKVLHCGNVNCSSGNTTTAPDTSGHDVSSYNISLALDGSGHPVVAYDDATANNLRILNCGDATCSSGNTITLPDKSGDDIGRSATLAIDIVDQHPVIAYTDGTTGELKVMRCGSFDCPQGTIALPDRSGDTAGQTAIALDSSRHPVVSYYDVTTGDLELLNCGDDTCHGAAIPDTSGKVANTTSMKLDGSGHPVIAYNDYVDGTLKVLHCGNSDCSSANTIVAPDSSGDDVSSYGASLALDGSGNPVVSYDDDTVGTLRVLTCGNPVCSSGNTITTPDTSGDITGRASSLVLDGAGHPVIAYSDDELGTLVVLHCGDATCSSGNIQTTPDGSSDTVGVVSSLALDGSGNPVVAYNDDDAGWLKVLHCGNPTCTAGNTITVPDASGDVGEFMSLVLDASGKPIVAYYDATNGNLNILYCADTTCGAKPKIARADRSDDDVGEFASLVLDSLGAPVVGYFDHTVFAPKVLHCKKVKCSSSKKAGLVVDPTGTNTGYYVSLVLGNDGNPVLAYTDDDSNLRVLHCRTPDCS